MRSSRLCLATIVAGTMALPVLAAPAVLQPPVTGTMYNGNNAAAPKLDVSTADSNQDSVQATNGSNTTDQTNGSGPSAAHTSDAKNSSNVGATANTVGSGSSGSVSRAGGGN